MVAAVIVLRVCLLGSSRTLCVRISGVVSVDLAKAVKGTIERPELLTRWNLQNLTECCLAG